MSHSGSQFVHSQSQAKFLNSAIPGLPSDKVLTIQNLPVPLTVLSSDLGISMMLFIAPYLPISPDHILMVRFAPPLTGSPEYGLPTTPFVPSLHEGIQDENMATFIVNDKNERNDGRAFLEQMLCQPHPTENTDLNSNDTVLKNLKQLEVENSSSEGLVN
ncbi:hypothetical protein Ancab_004693 [Ancistrocladus abbreviatus]